jgi:hypothetical protein
MFFDISGQSFPAPRESRHGMSECMMSCIHRRQIPKNALGAKPAEFAGQNPRGGAVARR